MSVPELDADQRRAALEKAAEARRVRAELKRKLKAGEISLEELLERSSGSDHLAKMRVAEVLASLPGYGKVRARRLMDELSIAESRRLRGLGTKQREKLLATFDHA